MTEFNDTLESNYTVWEPLTHTNNCTGASTSSTNTSTSTNSTTTSRGTSTSIRINTSINKKKQVLASI